MRVAVRVRAGGTGFFWASFLGAEPWHVSAGPGAVPRASDDVEFVSPLLFLARRRRRRTTVDFGAGLSVSPRTTLMYWGAVCMCGVWVLVWAMR